MVSIKDLFCKKTGRVGVVSVVLVLGTFAVANAEWKAKIRTTTDATRWTNEVAASVVAKTSTSVHVDVDTAAKLQTIDGFGGCFNELGWKALLSLPATSADSIMAALFDTVTGCKFSICRMPIGASDYALSWYSLNENNNDTLMTQMSVARDSAYLLQYIKAAMKYKPSLKIWGSPWSPPLWMKDNHDYQGGHLTWIPTMLNAYSLYLEKAVQLYQAQGINFYALSFQNESTQTPVYPGCLWSQTQHRDFIKFYIGPRFTNDNVNCEIWTPTMNCSDITYFTTMLNDALFASFITTVCFQWAGWSVLDEINQRYPNAQFKIYQTEQECGGGETGAALWTYAVQSVFYNMKYYFDRKANSYMQWNMVLAPSGFSTWGWPQNAMVTVDTVTKRVAYNPQYYVVKHFSYYVMPNARKVTVTGNFSNQVAFQNPDGSIVVVFSNESTSATQVGLTFGSSMINVSLQPNSFTTAVIYDSSANNVVYRYNAHSGSAIAVTVTRTGNTLVLTPPLGSSFDLQLFGIDGRIKASFSSQTSRGSCVVRTDNMPSAIYVLKGTINGRKYSSTIPFVNN
jgi:glucosylceramidase